MKPVAKIVFDTKYDPNMTLVSKSRPQIFKTNVDLMGFEPDTYLYTADQLREAQVKVLREAASECEGLTQEYNCDGSERMMNHVCADYLNRRADELERSKT